MLAVGARFDSLASFEAILKQHCEERGCPFVKTKSKKLKSDSAYLLTIKYDGVIFSCKQGPRRMPLQSKGERPNQRSFKCGCEAKVRLVADESTGPCQLRISTCNLEHANHPHGTQLSSLFPENRKPEMDDVLGSILKFPSVSNRDLRDYIKDKQNKTVFSRDIVNFRVQVRQNSQVETAEIEKILSRIETDGGKFQYGVNDQQQLQFLCFFIMEMSVALRRYPELLVIDSTYKTNENCYVLFNILAIDSNGQGHPVFLSFLKNETSSLLSQSLEFVKACYDSEYTKTVFIDKDMADLNAIESEREERFSEIREEILKICPPQIVEYFQANWWGQEKLWAACFSDSSTFQISTTNHIESYHQNLNKIVSPKTSLSHSLTEILKTDSQIHDTRSAVTQVQYSFKNVQLWTRFIMT